MRGPDRWPRRRGGRAPRDGSRRRRRPVSGGRRARWRTPRAVVVARTRGARRRSPRREARGGTRSSPPRTVSPTGPSSCDEIASSSADGKPLVVDPPAPPGAGRGRRCRRPPRPRPGPGPPARTGSRRDRAGHRAAEPADVACSADPAARSSSAKNGLPSDRRAMRSTSDGGTGAPWMAASWSASSARSNRSRSTCSTRGRRASSASQGRSGCRRWSSSERYVTISEDPFIAKPSRDERQQVARRPVGPVDVLHDEGHGPPPAETLEQDR